MLEELDEPVLFELRDRRLLEVAHETPGPNVDEPALLSGRQPQRLARAGLAVLRRDGDARRHVVAGKRLHLLRSSPTLERSRQHAKAPHRNLQRWIGVRVAIEPHPRALATGVLAEALHRALPARDCLHATTDPHSTVWRRCSVALQAERARHLSAAGGVDDEGAADGAHGALHGSPAAQDLRPVGGRAFQDVDAPAHAPPRRRRTSAIRSK